jgi:hypothetical protein
MYSFFSSDIVFSQKPSSLSSIIRSCFLTISSENRSLLYCKRKAVTTTFPSAAVKNSSISHERLSKLMLETDELAADIGTVIDGIDAVKEGLIDSVGGLGDALLSLKDLIGNK